MSRKSSGSIVGLVSLGLLGILSALPHFWIQIPLVWIKPYNAILLILGVLSGCIYYRQAILERRHSFSYGIRHSSDQDSLAWLALCAVIVGAFFRFSGTSWGLPEHFHPDEIPKAQVILRMYESGTLNPGYFLHPTLLLYLSYTMNLLLHGLGIEGSFYDTTFLAGRLVSAVVGTLSIYLVYLIGTSLYTQGSGVIASWLLAVFPLHVTTSRYMKEDSLLVFFLLLSLLLSLQAAQSGKIRTYIGAGFCAGLSMSSKYSGAVSVVFLLVIPWIRSRDITPDMKSLFALPASLVAMCIGFLMGTPYSVLASAQFLAGVTSERNHMLRGHTESISAWSQWWLYHWGRSIIPGTTTIPTLVASIGIGMLLYRRRLEDLIVVGCFLLFYLPAEWVKAKPAPQPERYILPCLPFLGLAAAECIRVLWIDGRRILCCMIVLGMIGAPLYRTYALHSELYSDTRVIAQQWIKDFIPQGSKVVIDFQPYSPTVDPSQITIINNPMLPEGKWLDLHRLQNAGVDYIVLSSLSYDRFFSQPGQPPGMRMRIRKMFALPLIKEFQPQNGTYGFHNPTIRIYQIPKQAS